MKSKKRMRKKFIFGLVAVVTAAGILAVDLTQNVSVAEAKQPTFTRIQSYQTTGLKVLEITPTEDDAELGYFFTTGLTGNPQSGILHDVTKGTKFKSAVPSTTVTPTVTTKDINKVIDEIWSNANNNGDTIYSGTLKRDVPNPVPAIWGEYKHWNYGTPNVDWASPYPNEAAAKTAWLATNPTINGTPIDQYIRDILNQMIASGDYGVSTIDDEVYYAAALLRYGMVKPIGPDNAHNQNHGANSEYPIYDAAGKGLFAQIAANEFQEYDIPAGNAVLGHYISVADGEGEYQLKDGYIIGDGQAHNLYDNTGTVTGTMILEQDRIYRVVTVTQISSTPIPVPGLTVPDSANVVSGNATAPIADTQGVTPYATGDLLESNFIPVMDKVVIPTVIEYVGTGGNASFEYQLNHDDKYYGYTTQRIVFLSGNREYRVGAWLEEYILGDADLWQRAEYRQRNASQVTKADLDWANLIYVSGTADEYYALGAGGYLSDAMVIELYNQSAVHHKAVIMDYLITDGDTNGYSSHDKLALLLWQDDQQQIASLYPNYFVEVQADADDATGDPKYEIIPNSGILNDAAALAALQSSRLSGYNGNFAVNNIYVYNHHVSDFLGSRLERYQNDALDVLANGDLKTPYTSAATNGGFQAVLAYIKINNENLVSGKMTENYVTPAIAIQFILCYRGESLLMSKGQYTVLEIQPTREFKFNSTTSRRDYALETEAIRKNRDQFIKDCLSDSIVETESQDLVIFDSMSIDEFNTMQDDLLTSYDVVYIGALHDTYYQNANTASMTILNGSLVSTTASIPQYNDRSMTGYVYFNMGDTTGQNATRETAYTSRDLTGAKLTELQRYLENSGLLIVDGDLMRSLSKGNVIINPTKVESTTAATYDHGRMDDSSNMYALFEFARGTEGTYYSNFVSEADLSSKMVLKADLTNSLNRERLNLYFSQKPSEYTYTNNTAGDMNVVSYLSVDGSDGRYYLDFEFSFVNTAEISSPTEFYLIHFYQDMNANGRFEEAEEKFDYEVTFSADGSQAANGTDADGVTRYSLNADVMYKLRRQVPADEGGYINWCIRIEKLTNSNVYCEASGNTAIKPREQKYINILQIEPNSGATMNLENLSNSENLYKYLHAIAVEDQYLITVRTITVDQFQRDTNKYFNQFSGNFQSQEELWTEYFNNFQRTDGDIYTDAQIKNDEDSPMSVNMIILGFGGTYTQFTNDIPINALLAYIESTKPLLTSNNVVGSNIDIDRSDRTLNYRFLSEFSQDRFGYTNALYTINNLNTNTIWNRTEQVALDNYFTPREGARQAIAYVPGSGRNSAHLIPIAYTNTVRARQSRANANANAFINATGVNSLYNGSDPTANASRTYVDQMNDGQIAHYPFEVGGSILLSKTQAQTFQLDLDTDSNGDGFSDVVVWYTLGDMANAGGAPMDEANIYSATPGDGINNYYVYNAGTITFTGIGATNVSNLTSAEGQLFVNTLIAAYEAGLVNPTVSFYETADSNASMLDSIAIPYDKNVTGDNAVDSSIMRNETNTDYRYKFVNPNTGGNTADATKAYFKIQDSNNVRGEKSAKVTFYMAVEGTPGNDYALPDGGTAKIQQIQLNDNTVATVVRIPIDIYTANFGQLLGTSSTENALNNPQLEVATMYGFYVPMSYIKDRGAVKIYIQADTGYAVIDNSTGANKIRSLGTAYDMFTIIKQDLLKLD